MTQSQAGDLPEGSRLADPIMVGVEQRFLQYGHRPSRRHWKGLRAIAETIELRAVGTAKPKFYLSSLPTGMGKTTVVAEGVRALVSDPAYERVGAVLFVNQLNQIPRLIEETRLREDQFPVRTGVGNVELYAQVLFTTQQKLPHLLRYKKNFSEIPFFKYQGSPRRVRIWDEAILPAEPLTLKAREIEEVASRLTQIKQHQAGAVLRMWLQKELPFDSSDSVVEVPTFILEMEVGVLDKLKDESDAFHNLLWMSGQEVRLHRGSHAGETTISYREVLPKEFAPLLVFNASGSLRLTYKLWEEGRRNLVRLSSPGKSYNNLTIHHWTTRLEKILIKTKRR